VVETLGIPGRDVASDALVEAEPREEAESGGQTLLAVEPLVLDRIELRGQREHFLRHEETSTKGIRDIQPTGCGVQSRSPDPAATFDTWVLTSA
jgi:hypothetical protein